MNLPPNSPRAKMAIIADILAIDNPIAGTLTTTFRTLKDGSKQPHYHLQKSRKGKNITTYIPPEKVERVKQGIEQYKKLKALNDELEQAGLNNVLNSPGETGSEDVKKKQKSSTSPKNTRNTSPASRSRPSPR